jgi:hypothetical protein
MPAAPRIRDLVALLSRRFARLGDLRCHQSNFGIATEGTDVSLYSVGPGEPGVKEWHSIYTMLSNTQVA